MNLCLCFLLHFWVAEYHDQEVFYGWPCLQQPLSLVGGSIMVMVKLTVSNPALQVEYQFKVTGMIVVPLLDCMCWAIVDNLLRCSLSWIPLVSYSSRCFVKKLSPEVPAVYSGILICDHRRNRWGRTTSFQTRSKHSSLILCSTGRISKWDSGNYLK